jgi:hypothetical protein
LRACAVAAVVVKAYALPKTAADSLRPIRNRAAPGFPKGWPLCPVCASEARHGKLHKTNDIHVVIVQGVHEQGPNPRQYSRRLCGDLNRRSPGLTHDGCFGHAGLYVVGTDEVGSRLLSSLVALTEPCRAYRTIVGISDSFDVAPGC